MQFLNVHLREFAFATSKLSLRVLICESTHLMSALKMNSGKTFPLDSSSDCKCMFEQFFLLLWVKKMFPGRCVWVMSLEVLLLELLNGCPINRCHLCGLLHWNDGALCTLHRTLQRNWDDLRIFIHTGLSNVVYSFWLRHLLAAFWSPTKSSH